MANNEHTGRWVEENRRMKLVGRQQGARNNGAILGVAFRKKEDWMVG